VSFFIFSQTSR